MLSTKFLLLLSAATTANISLPEPSGGESCERQCWPTPLLPAFATVPASIKGVSWLRKYPLKQDDWYDQVWLFEVLGEHDDAPKEPVPFTVQESSVGPAQGYVIVPKDGFKPNTRYSVRVDGGDPKCNSDIFEYEFSDFITSSRLPFPEPGPLGTLIMPEIRKGPLLLASDSKECSVSANSAQAAMQVELTPELRPWFRVLMFETLVDGKPWTPEHSANGPDLFGESWNGRSKDIVFVNCETQGNAARSKGLDSGSHTVQMRARIEGSPHVYSSDIVHFDISCETTGVVTTGGSLDGIENEKQDAADTTATPEAPAAQQPKNLQTCSMTQGGSLWGPASLTFLLLLSPRALTRRRSEA